MHDMTKGPITQHLIRMAAPIAIGMLFQTLYLLIDLYFVARIGDAAIAGVGAAGNLMFIVMAATQVLGVGTTSLIAQAVGRKDQADANLVFNQSLAIAMACMLLTLLIGYPAITPYMHALGAGGGHSRRHRLHALVSARPGPAVRAGGDRLGTAWLGIAQPAC